MKTILITGASGALGGSVAQRFLDEGWTVLGTYGGASPAALPRHERLHWVQVELADAAAVRAAVSSWADRQGPIDALAHCAGGFRWAALADSTDADIDFLLGANLKSTILVLRAVLPLMKARGFGRIVLIGARSAQHPGAGISVYAATKAGVHALVASVAEEVRPHDITINALLPAIIDTPVNRRDMPAADPREWVTPEQLAGLVFALTEPSHSAVNGALIAVPAKL